MVSRRKVHTDCGHEVKLTGAASFTTDLPPVIMERKEEDFIGALLEELHGEPFTNPASNKRPEDAFRTLAEKYVPKQSGADGLMRLYQPVHRVFNLALLEAHCASFGSPRLDARQIESAGLVVRRVRRRDDSREELLLSGKGGGRGGLSENDLRGVRPQKNARPVYEAWCSTKGIATGWVALPPTDDPDHDRDPEAVRHPQPRYTGNAGFDRKTFGTSGPAASEDTVSLFVAPPPVATLTTRTVLYGVIPLASSSRAGPMAKGPEASDSEWSKHLSLLLKSEKSIAISWPTPEKPDPTENADLLQPSDLARFPVTLPDLPASAGANRFILLVRQLAQEFSLLRPANPDTMARLLKELDKLEVTVLDGTIRTAGSYLQQAAQVYFEEPKTPVLAVLRPATWPAVPPDVATNIFVLLKSIAREIELSIFGSENGAGRYDDPNARYVIRAFIRVKQPCDCPPKIVWSPYSERFSIAPWFESGPYGPVPVMLPDLTPDFLNKAKPNVAFSVPSALAKVLNQDPKSIVMGLAGKGSGPSLDFMCGFNIPIITICAFILLNIMLYILNYIFRWLPYVKVCIPFPRPPATPQVSEQP